MTAIELLFFTMRVCVGIGVATYLWGLHPVIGVSAGIAAYLTLPAVITVLTHLFGDKPIGKPICPNGCCHNDDYLWKRSEDHLPVCMCKCGIEFVAIGRRFMRHDANGNNQPYMVWTRKKGWIPEGVPCKYSSAREHR